MSLCNAGGRLAIGPLSDATSLRFAYLACGLQIPVVLALPAIAAMAPTDPEFSATLWKGATCLVPLFYGGYVVLLAPAVATVFGTDRVGTVFPRIFAVLNLSNLFAAALVGRQRDAAVHAAATDLAATADPAAFELAFGAPLEALPSLIDAKTATIPALIALAPPGTPDPSPLIYADTLTTLAATSVLALACHVGALSLKRPDPTGATGDGKPAPAA